MWFDWGCALQGDGSLSCFGEDFSGQQSPPTGDFVSVSVGDAEACAIRTDGTLVCWGSPFAEPSGEVGNPPAGAFVDVAVGSYGACALAGDGSTSCWGRDGGHWILAGPFVALDAGHQLYCGLDSDGVLHTWTDGSSDLARPVPGSFVGLSCPGPRVCAVTAKGEAVCTPRTG